MGYHSGHLLVGVCIVVQVLSTGTNAVEPVSFHRYRKAETGDNLYTTDTTEIGTTKFLEVGKNGYMYLGVACKIYPESVEGTKTLHRYVRKSNSATHIYTINDKEIEAITASNEWRFEKYAGDCYPTQRENTIPLYRYRKGEAYEYTVKPNKGRFTPGVSRDGFTFEGIACYVPVKDPKRGWKLQWKRDLNIILGDTPAKQEHELSSNIHEYLTSKYFWRDWFVVVYPDMYGDDNHWRHGCFLDIYTVNKMHWKRRYNIMVSSVDKNKPVSKFTGDASTNLKKNTAYDARSIYENLPGKARTCRYPLAGVVKAEGAFAVRAPMQRNFYQMVKHYTKLKDCWMFCGRTGHWHVFILG